MKRVLVVMFVLALAMLACSTGTTSEPQIVYVEVTATPQFVAPTVAPVVPQAKAGPDIPDATREYLLGLGFTGPAIDNKGENDCSQTYCIHYDRSLGGMAFSHYYVGDELVGMVLSHTLGEEDGPFGEFAFYAFAKSGMPDNAIQAIADLLGVDGGGQRDLDNGWRAKVLVSNGRLFLIILNPDRADNASYNGQGA